MRTILRVILTLVFTISIWTFFSPYAWAQDPASYRLVLTPTADPFPKRVCLSTHLMTFPTTLIPQLTIPVGSRFGLQTYIGYGILTPDKMWVLGSIAVKLSLISSDSSHWGLAFQGQWMGAGAVFGGEGVGGTVTSGQLVASSPRGPKRIHAGIALHTLPGSSNGQHHNLQVTPSACGELSISRRVRILTELVWIAPGADQGWDSIFFGLIGFRFKLGKTTLDLSSGIFQERAGSNSPRTFPVPPLVALTVQL